MLNFARAAIVDEAAVIAALEPAGCTPTCATSRARLKDHPRVVTLPHLGASTGEAEENCAVMVAEQLRDFLENGNIRNSVNYPDAVLPRCAEHHSPRDRQQQRAEHGGPDLHLPRGAASTSRTSSTSPAASAPIRSSIPTARSAASCRRRSRAIDGVLSARTSEGRGARYTPGRRSAGKAAAQRSAPAGPRAMPRGCARGVRAASMRSTSRSTAA